jgi:FkbM family methyltransferase
VPRPAHEFGQRRGRGFIRFVVSPTAMFTGMNEGVDETTRSYSLSLPHVDSFTPQHLAIDLPAHFYVPKLLQQSGFAGYERSTIACWLALLSIPRHGVAMDVGANVGPYAWLASLFSPRRVVAFEPTPALANAIRAVADRNQLDIEVEQIALSDRDGHAEFYLSDATDSSNSLVAGFRASSNSIEVPTVRLDSYVADTGLVPQVMKIDTETSEPEVLSGAKNVIATLRPWMIIEVLAGRTEERLMIELAPHEYFWFRIDADLPLATASEIVGDPTYENTNWLFAPTRPNSTFWMEMARWHELLGDCTPAQH